MMKPYYEESGITIYHGDCREVLPTLAPTADSLITDPPYAIVNTFGVQKKPNGSRRLQFDWDGDGAFESVMEGIDLALELLPQSAFVFCGYDTVTPINCALREHGLTPKPFAWVKKCPAPAAPGNWWPSAFELAVYGYREGAWFGDTDPKRANVIVADSYRYGQPGKVDHPNQKPLAIIQHLVESITPASGRVVDPFMGSGTTLVAAKQCGLRAIGIEVNEAYCEMAVNRLKQGVLFGAA
jgi:site-specific DNA-methyltransferase (adenine-specific)